MTKSILTVLLGALVALAGVFSGLIPHPTPGGASAPISIPITGQIEVGFSPKGGAEALVIRAIASAQQEILVAAYSFTSKPIAAALLAAHQRGVVVRAVLDKSQRSEKYSAATFLANQGIAVRIDEKHAIQHNKYLVIDGHTVELGSFNYSRAAAERNAENVVVLWNQPAVARQYRADWERLWDAAAPYAPRS
jgi:phosphatidylserine/phosphatidylglycerophosphate/cardiolipin synthase-like enzyme